MKTKHFIIIAIVVLLLLLGAWLLCRRRKQQQPPATDTGSNTATGSGTASYGIAPGEPNPGASTSSMIPVASRVEIKDGIPVNPTLPAPYNAMRVYDSTSGTNADPAYTNYYMSYRDDAIPQPVWATRWLGTDAAYIAYRNPAFNNIRWIINPSGQLIFGSF